MSVCARGVPGFAVQPVDDGNSESAVRFLIEWVSDGEAEARRYLADYAEPEGANLIATDGSEVIGYVAIISSTGPALVGIAASPGGNDKLSPRRWRCACYGQRPSADAGPRNQSGHPLRVIFVAGRAFLAQDCGRSTRPAEMARFGASVGSLHRCRRIPVSLRK